MSPAASYTLKHPLTTTIIGSEGTREEQLTQIDLRRLKAKDLRVADGAAGEVAVGIALVARISGLTVAQVDELDAEDFTALMGIVEGFTPPGLRTGKTSSET